MYLFIYLHSENEAINKPVAGVKSHNLTLGRCGDKRGFLVAPAHWLLPFQRRAGAVARLARCGATAQARDEQQGGTG